MPITARLLAPTDIVVSCLDLSLASRVEWRRALEDYAEALQELCADRFDDSNDFTGILARAAELVQAELDGRALYRVRAVDTDGQGRVEFMPGWLRSRVNNPAAWLQTSPEIVLSIPAGWAQSELRALTGFEIRKRLKTRRAAERSRNRNPRAAGH